MKRAAGGVPSSAAKRPKALPRAVRHAAAPAGDQDGGGEIDMEEEWPAAATAVAQSARPQPRMAPLTADTVEKGMVIIYDGHKGWVDNCFGELDEFWVRSEHDGELVRQAQDGVPKASLDIRTFSSSEMAWTGDWSREVLAAGTVDVPKEATLRRFLLSTGGDNRLAQLSEKLGVLLSVEVDETVTAANIERTPFTVIVGPGFTPDVKAVVKLLSQELKDLCLNTSLESVPQVASETSDMNLYGSVPSWMNTDGTDKEITVQNTTRTGDSFVMHSLEAEEYKRGYEAAMKMMMEEDDSSDEEEDEDDENVVSAAGHAGDADKAATDQNKENAGGNGNSHASSTAKEEAGEETTAKESAAPEDGVKRTVLDWAVDQTEFADLTVLPAPWIRIRSSNGKIYYVNTETGATSFVEPESDLPSGWAAVVSKSSGKQYYWNAALQKSQFVRPTA